MTIARALAARMLEDDDPKNFFRTRRFGPVGDVPAGYELTKGGDHCSEFLWKNGSFFHTAIIRPCRNKWRYYGDDVVGDYAFQGEMDSKGLAIRAAINAYVNWPRRPLD